MKKVYLIHGWGGSSQGGWFTWIKQQLEGKAEVRAFDMPDTNYPKIDDWVNFIKNNILELDNETYFIGHSIGCQAILRFLETLEEGKKIGGCVFVAGWFNLKPSSFADKEEKEVARPWLSTPIDFDKVKQHCKNFLAIFSDTDPYVPITDEKLFKEKLDAKTIIKHDKEHFNKWQEMPEIINFITR